MMQDESSQIVFVWIPVYSISFAEIFWETSSFRLILSFLLQFPL